MLLSIFAISKVFRNLFKTASEALVYSSIWITLCAMAMFENTSLWVLGTMRFRQLNIYIIASTLFLYSLHRLLSQKRITQPLEHYKQWFNRYRIWVVAICILSGIVACAVFFFLPFAEEVGFAVFGACALLYEIPALVIGKKRYRLRDLGLLKMLSIILVWMGSTVWMPIFKFTSFMQTAHYTPLILAQLCFFTVLCLAFDERDSAYDIEQGIHTWATRIGTKRLKPVYIALMLLYIVFSAVQVSIDPIYGTALIGSVVATTAFTLWFVLKPAKHPLFHYVFVDGLMIVQALCTCMAITLS